MLRASFAGFNGALLLVLDVFLWHWHHTRAICIDWEYGTIYRSIPYCVTFSFRYLAPWPWLVGIGLVAILLIAYAWFCYSSSS